MKICHNQTLIKDQFIMNKLTLLLFFIASLLSVQAQHVSNDSIKNSNQSLILKLGVNLLDSTGDNNPFTFLNDFDQQAFSNNLNIELEYKFNRWLGASGAWSINQWKANKGNIDGNLITKDINYSALDIDLKFYYSEAFRWFDTNNWLELYLHGGAGSASHEDQSNITLNLGPGANIWFTNRFGINLNGTGKWISNNENVLYNTNHFQYSASLMYRLIHNDKDNDGVRNKDDKCPKISGTIANNGCPPEEQTNDRDGDGVMDAFDHCPDVFGTGIGCPETELIEVDTDGDSVLDSVDECPKIKGLPTNSGCPLPDSDNDGIVDAADKCPSVAGLESNNGCPFEEILVGDTNSLLNQYSKEILFNKGNYNFRQDSYPVLFKIVEMMKQYPEAQYKIEGHTDSVGSYASNKRLSQTRMNAVRNYLVNSGIPAENLILEAFGETKPRASNLTKEGQRLNRRVEIIRIK